VDTVYNIIIPNRNGDRLATVIYNTLLTVNPWIQAAGLEYRQGLEYKPGV